MKTRNILKNMLTMVLVCMGAMPLMAQKNIDKVIEDLDKRSDVAINSVVKRDPKTRKITRMVKTYTLNDSRMAGVLIRAFEKDEEYAITAIKDMPKGRGRASSTEANFTFIFYKGDIKSTYTLFTNEKKGFTITIITNPDGKGNHDWTFIYPNDLNLNNLEAMGHFQISDEQKELINKQFEEIRKRYKDKFGTHISEK